MLESPSRRACLSHSFLEMKWALGVLTAVWLSVVKKGQLGRASVRRFLILKKKHASVGSSLPVYPQLNKMVLVRKGDVNL